jgi:hypothetical protein
MTVKPGSQVELPLLISWMADSVPLMNCSIFLVLQLKYKGVDWRRSVHVFSVALTPSFHE